MSFCFQACVSTESSRVLCISQPYISRRTACSNSLALLLLSFNGRFGGWVERYADDNGMSQFITRLVRDDQDGLLDALQMRHHGLEPQAGHTDESALQG